MLRTEAFLCFSIFLTFGQILCHSMTMKYMWSNVNYEFGSTMKEEEVIASGDYIENQAIPTSLETWRNKLFVVTPRIQDGVPSTLSYVDMNAVSQQVEQEVPSPKLIPYPNFEIHNLTAQNMTSIVCVRADPCDRLWALDAGVVMDRRESPPAIHIIDLETSRVIAKRELEEGSDYDEDSAFSTIVVDVTSSDCDDAYAYLSDHIKSMLVIYSLATDATRRITHNFFNYDPVMTNLNVDESMKWPIPNGIYSMALSPVERDDFRRLYFSPMASNNQFIVSTEILRNKSSNPQQQNVYEFKIMGSRGTSGHTSAAALDEETGAFFYTLISRNALGCWNSYRGLEFKQETQWSDVGSPETYFFPNDVRVDKRGGLWLLVNNYMEVIFNLSYANNVNFKVFNGNIRELIKSTPCDIR